MIRDTSFDAWADKLLSGKISNQEHAILVEMQKSIVWYDGVRRDDYSLKEISAVTGIAINAVSGRVNGLKKKGILEECAKRRCQLTGRLIRPVAIKYKE